MLNKPKGEYGSSDLYYQPYTSNYQGDLSIYPAIAIQTEKPNEPLTSAQQQNN